MPAYTFHLVDAFTQTPFTGNPCAVVADAQGLSDEDMTKIARETNAPESAFVFKSDKADVKVRYFMPRGEIPFAGHPTIATAGLLHKLGKLATGTARFEFNIGVLPVEIAADHVTMTQPPAEPSTVLDSRATMQALGLDVADLCDNLPICLMKGGVSFVLVPVRAFDVLGRISMDRPALKAILAPLGVSAAYVFSRGGIDPKADAHARLIDPDNAGEDPFTGSAAGCMASYLFAHTDCPSRILLEQGHLLQRPGNGTLELVSEGGKLQKVLLSGACVVSATGSITW